MRKNIATMLLVVACLAGCRQASNTDAPRENLAVDTTTTSYLTAVARYLVDSIGSHYASADYCVPTYTVVASDESDTDDIRVWGDFWVINYNLAGDTLKTVSGGSHPGLMHLRKVNGRYEVVSFDAVADGHGYTESAKQIFGNYYDTFSAITSDDEQREMKRGRDLAVYAKEHNLHARFYQDYGWPAVPLP